MFIRAVQKKDKKKKTTYTYYRLTHSYRIGNKTRQSVLLNMGKLENVPKVKHKSIRRLLGVPYSLFGIPR